MYVIVLRDKALRNLALKNVKKEQMYAFDDKGDLMNIGQVRPSCPTMNEERVFERFVTC